MRLLPGNTLSRDRAEFWDWPSVACVASNIVETYHAFFYLVDPKLDEDQVNFRILLMQLHLNTEKYKLYKEWGASSDVLEDFEQGLPHIRGRLSQNPWFQTLPEKKRTELLKGGSAMHLKHSDIGASLPFMDRHFKPIYRLFSNHVHSTPFSYQATSNERGRGDENEAERFYMILAMQVVTKYVTAAVLDMARVCPNEVERNCLDQIERARKIHNE
jgi:hypothetical protein